MRLFCAIEPSDALRARLVEVPRAISARGFRFVERAQLHLTMRFLGDVDDAWFPAIGAAVLGVVKDTAPFSLEVSGAGTFAARGAPRVLWAGVDDSAGRLAALAEGLSAALDPILGPPDRPFTAHVTLGRAKGGGANVDQGALAAVGALGTLRVDELVLFESTMASNGVLHTARARALLGAPG